MVFHWERRDAFCRQPLGDALFSWTERYQCITSVINSVVGTGNPSESLVKKLQDDGIIKEIMPLHRKPLVFRTIFVTLQLWWSFASNYAVLRLLIW